MDRPKRPTDALFVASRTFYHSAHAVKRLTTVAQTTKKDIGKITKVIAKEQQDCSKSN